MVADKQAILFSNRSEVQTCEGMQVRRREYLLAYLAVVLAIAFTAAPAVAMYPGGGGGGGCPTATVTFRIYATTQNPLAGSVGSIAFGVNRKRYLAGG